MLFCCCGPAVLLRIGVCSGGVAAGAAVVISTGGVPVASGTTDGGGRLDITGLPGGSHSFVASGFSGGRFAASSNFTVPDPIPVAPVPFVINATILAGPGYVCMTACPLPISNRVLLTWSNCDGFFGIGPANNPSTLSSGGTGWIGFNGPWTPGSMAGFDNGNVTPTHVSLTCPTSLRDTFSLVVPGSIPQVTCTAVVTELAPVS